MSQENVEIVRKSVQAFLENDFEGWFALASPDYKLYPRPEEPGAGLRVEQRFAHAFKIEDGKGTEWRMFGPVEEAFEALGLYEQDAHPGS